MKQEVRSKKIEVTRLPARQGSERSGIKFWLLFLLVTAHYLGVVVVYAVPNEHNLKQEDLSEIGSQGVVSEILNGKRQLNVNQIKKLGERFHVSPAVFL